jgi:glycosyltransferase involved in cell wall biosynthesis
LGEALKVYEAHEHWLVCPTHVLWRHNRELCDERQCLRCVLRYRRPPQLWRFTNTLSAQLDNVHLLIAKSEFSRRKHKQFGLAHEMEVVPYFLPDQAADDESTEPPHDRPYFLFVGRLEKIKGLQDVIPEFARYGDADLLIVGSGEYEQELRRLSSGIPAVKFVGRLPPDKLARYYRHAIALIVPSICFETFGIILIESFQRGTPVIARSIGPFVEIVERSGGGMLFSSMSEMVEAMRRLQGDTRFRESVARAAREAFMTHWCEDVVMSEYLAKLHSAAKSAGNERIQKLLEAELAQ